VPDDSPYTTGTIGLLGTRPSQEAIEECDTLLMVGTSFPYIEQAGKLAESLARGQPNRSTIALTVLSDKVREMV
jgi:thiamine pyrophosphate-dependent acetolactate synthase large subunit-like protein